MNRLPRVVFVVPSMHPGGTERQLVLLMQGLSEHFELGLVCTRDEGGLIGHARRVASHVRILDTRSGWDFRLRERLRRVFAVQHPAVVHSFLSGFDYWATAAAREIGVPVVLTARRELAGWQRARHLWLVRRGNRHADLAVANSAAAAAYAAQREGMPREHYRVIYNGLERAAYEQPLSKHDARRRYRLPEHAPIVGMAANFTPVKDHALFVAAAGRIKAALPEAHFFLMGTGPLMEETRRSLVDTVGRDAFTIRHTLDEMPAAYAAMDVAVLTSTSEGAPNVVLEAQAAGRPVVASAVGGVPELLRAGVTGELVTERSGEAFAAPVIRLLCDASERVRMGEAARAHALEHFSAEQMVAQYRALYRELLVARGVGGG